VVGLGDVPFGRALAAKRIEKATERSVQWWREHVALRRNEGARARLFAPLLPVSCATQGDYIDCLLQDLAVGVVHGLAVYDLSSLEDLPKELGHLPRLGFTAPETPHDVLGHIASGLDVLTIPFITSATEAGIALTFTFPTPHENDDEQNGTLPFPLGVDMWSPQHAVDLSPLDKQCVCYTCATHHRAYVQHLLSAKEMLGWVLLQIHNHSVVDRFFAAVRGSMVAGRFERDVEVFGRGHERRLPEGTGKGPR